MRTASEMHEPRAGGRQRFALICDEIRATIVRVESGLRPLIDTTDVEVLFQRAVMMARQEPMWDLLHEAASAGGAGDRGRHRLSLTSTDADTKATAIDLLGVIGEFHADQRDAIVATLAGIGAAYAGPATRPAWPVRSGGPAVTAPSVC